VGQRHFRRGWTRVLSKRRLTEFEEALLDPELTSLRQELVKIDLRIHELEERHKASGETRDGWRRVGVVADKLKDSLMVDDDKDVDLEKLRTLVSELGERVNRGLDDYALWDDLTPLIDRRRRLTQTELEREKLLQVSIPMAQLIILFNDLQGAIESVLPTRELQLKLLQELRLRFNREGQNDPRAGKVLRLPAAFDAVAEAGDDAQASGEVDRDSEPVD